MTLRVGHIAYANCIPFFHYLGACGFCGRIIPGVPSELNSLLAAGRLDISPSSSFEYGRNWSSYRLLPALTISSRGPVKSVLLFSHAPLEKMADTPIAATGESATSINLLRILLREFLGSGSGAEIEPRPESIEEHIAAGGTGLLIGDRALRGFQAGLAPRIYDLGELWWRHTGLPFVFALWIVGEGPAGSKSREVKKLQRQLQTSLARTLDQPEKTAAEASGYEWFGIKNLADYWRCMSYDFSPAHRQGLELFFRLSVKHGLLPGIPELRFFEPPETP